MAVCCDRCGTEVPDVPNRCAQCGRRFWHVGQSSETQADSEAEKDRKRRPYEPHEVTQDQVAKLLDAYVNPAESGVWASLYFTYFVMSGNDQDDFIEIYTFSQLREWYCAAMASVSAECDFVDGVLSCASPPYLRIGI